MPFRPPLFFLLCLLSLISHKLADATSDGQFAFDGFTGDDLSLDGMATAMPNGLLMLTNGAKQLKGHAFYPNPLRFRSPNSTTLQSFSTTFVFGIIGEYLDLSSHGMAFVICPSKNLSTALQSQFLGLLNANDDGNRSNHIFAVELDTVLNTELDDIDDNHVGVDVNSLKSVKAASAGYHDDKTGTFHNLSLISRNAMQVWVDYDSQAMELDVTLAPLDVSKPTKPLLSVAINLSTVIPDMAYVGFSSSTGIVFSRHFVLGWSFKLNGMAPALDISNLPTLPRTDPKHRSSKALAIALPIAFVAFVVVVATTIFAFVRRRLQFKEVFDDWEDAYGPHRFSYADLFRATGGFEDKQLLGRGGFGRVYKGVLPTCKSEVAVKKVSHESRQGMKEFVAEIVSLRRLRHRNIVQLLGYCRRKGELLLVYDYMPNGSLDKYLFDRTKPTMEWALRFRIVKGVASGLLYLHEGWEQVVVHRDIKASNVLLDSEMNGRLGDFGLARLYDHGTDPHTTHVVGTMGYLAPELGHTSKATPVTDVFAFGAFLLEVTCGRRPVKLDEQDNRLMLVDWVLEHWRSGSVTDAVDPRLRGEYDSEQASLLLKLGLLCVHPLPSARPGMRQVMQYLDGDMQLPELSSTHLDFNMYAMMQSQGFEEYVTLYPMSTSSSSGTMSSLSGGR